MEIKVHPMGDYATNCYIVTVDNGSAKVSRKVIKN